MPLDAIIFDLDDTLIDWWGSLDRCLRRILDQESADALFEHCRREFWKLDPGETFIWHRNTWAMHHLRHEVWPEALPDMDEASRNALMDQFDRELFVEMFPETVTTLDALRQRVRLAVLSNNHLLADEVNRLGLDRWFELCLAAPLEALKPNAGAFAPILAEMGLDAASCLYVGDSVKADVGGALAAGLIPVWVDRWNDGWHDRPPHVHRIETLAGLPALVDELDLRERAR